jgi:peptidyl-prolyl cis-trans isomerase B (cyclophilin B)
LEKEADRMKVGRGLIILAFLILTAAISCQKGGDVMDDRNRPGAVIETSYGNMEIRFFPDKAPGHVENFIKLAKDGTYDGTIFHRVIPGFMIQGGDPNTKGENFNSYGQGGPGYTIDAEFNDISHKRGIVSMARSADPNSAGSQFFIVVNDSTFLDGEYTAFGEVTSGIEVADKLVNLPRDTRDLPNERVEIKVRIIE